jgi:hypothetical protein
MADSGQKFIGRNRAPRVQIEYDVEIYGAEKKVQWQRYRDAGHTQRLGGTGAPRRHPGELPCKW